MAEMRNFSDNGRTCYANVKLDSGEPCVISIAQTGVLVKRSRLGIMGAVLYDESVVYKNAMTAKALRYLYPARRTPAGITNAAVTSAPVGFLEGGVPEWQTTSGSRRPLAARRARALL